MDILLLLLFVFIGFFVGIYGVIVGGSGLVTIPLLIAVGLPPHVAIATSRAGLCLTSLAGIYNFNKKKLIDWKIAIIMTIFGIFGFIIGLVIFFNISAELLKLLVGVISIAGLIFLLVKKDLGVKKIKKLSKKHKIVGYFVIFLIAIYSGFFGTMFGTLTTFALILFFGMTFLKASGTRKLFGMTRMLITVPVFLIAGKVNIPLAIALLSGNGFGSYIGSHYADRIGNEKIRIVFIIITAIAIVKMFV